MNEPLFDYADLNTRPVESRQSSRAKQSALSIVNTEQYGKRITLALDIVEAIGAEDSVQVTINDEGIAIGHTLADAEGTMALRRSRGRAVIYCSSLVTELTDTFSLDFRDCTSISFNQVRYYRSDSGQVAFIPMVSPEPQTV